MSHAGIFKTYVIGEILTAPEADETPGGVKVSHFQMLVRAEEDDSSEGTTLYCSAWRGAAIAANKQLDVGMLVWAEGKISTSDDPCKMVLNVNRFQILSDIQPDSPQFSTAQGTMPYSGDPNVSYPIRRNLTHINPSQILDVTTSVPKNRLPPKPTKR